jgi:hypothetical protein
MPELKRLFLKGRMNKDLDERLVPNGEYRDALNIQVGSSEDSDVGAIENILGNQVLKLKKAFPATNWALESETANYYGLPLDAKCIGAIKDDINDKIYWLVTSSTIDCIIEYENQFGQVRPVLVDTQNVLNFSATKLITGINVLDNYLFFTDDNSEPKRINVTKGVFSSADFTTHSTYKGRNFIESDITVIKKSPLSAPSLAVANSDREIQGITNVNSSTVLNLSLSESNTGGQDDPKPVGTSLTITLSSPCAYKDGDFLRLTGPKLETDPEDFEYIAVVQITSINNLQSVNVDIMNIAEQVVDSNSYVYSVELQQETPPFEFKFPRFGYRWKYEDNQFSCFSPFTEVAFLPTEFNYNSKSGYNKGMVNTIQQVTLDNFETPPVDVKKIEILYKETNNATIYVVDDLNVSDISEQNWEGFKITSNLIFKVVQSNQLLRPWDNVPRLAKAQEIVGNRIIYGNYLQNFTLNETVKLDASLDSITQVNGEVPTLSVKSDRDYQIGVVFKDKYGRETPVFTSDSATIKVPQTASVDTNRIKVTPITDPPAGFDYFKYFVKDSSGEYYNVSLDRAYKSLDGLTMWLSFPSSERNKITEDTYLKLKKQHDSSLAVLSTDNKYKVLSISNEAPEELLYKKSIIETPSIGFVQSFGSNLAQTAKVAGKTPSPGSNTILIGRQNNADGVDDETKSNLIVGNFIRFTDGVSSSKFYEIASVTWSTSATQNSGRITFDQDFDDDINFLYHLQPPELIANECTFEIRSQVKETNLSKYQGKFFVNVEKNQLLIDALYKETDLTVVDSMTFKSFGSCNANANNVIETGAQDGYSSVENLYVQIWGGGRIPKRGYSNDHSNGGLLGQHLPGFANDASDYVWDIVYERWATAGINSSAWDRLGASGQKFKFANYPNDIYEVESSRRHSFTADKRYERIYVKLKQPFARTVNPNFFGGYASTTVLFLDLNEGKDYSSSNPAIFETEAKELADLNIYYEASEAFPIAQYDTSITKTLSWGNCFTFGNGVESNRIRDDFNAPFIDKGTKASTILEEPYEEERRATGLIYSGIYNSNSGLNDLNQFIQAEKITKDLNPIYGSIQKLHTRDTNLVSLCEDKILRILANKDALFNADGNTNVTSNNNVLGQAVPFNGEFGISKNPESFASYGYRAYFSDKKRGVVLRLSMDGLTEISSKGMSDYFYDNLKAATTVLGSYDIYSDTYTLTLNNNTVCFKESSDGWPTRKSFIPEWGISLNSDYYTMSNGMIWKHDNQNRNTFYEGATAKSSVQLVFNDNPNKIKNFKTLSYEGSNEWIAPLIQTDQQDGAVTTFLDKENIYYNYIRGLNDTWDNIGQSGTLDLKQFAAQGIANLASVETYNGNTTFKVVVKNDPADAETTYTVTEYDVEAEVGDQVNLSVTEFALNIIPNAGYVIDAADFSIGDALPSQINSVVFSNGTGGIVKATCTFDSSFIMPSNDVEILIDIDGVPAEQTFTIDGQYIIRQGNVQESATSPVAFSQTAVDGTEVTLFTKTFTATSGYYFAELPYYYQSYDQGSRSDSAYIITYVDTTVAGNTPGSSLVTARTYTVKYLINGQSRTLNSINFIAFAELIYVPPVTPELKAYTVVTDNFKFDGESRNISFYGEGDATFTLNINDGTTNTNYNLDLDKEGNLDYSLDVEANATGSTIVYTYTLSGNIESPFSQANPFTIDQPSSVVGTPVLTSYIVVTSDWSTSGGTRNLSLVGDPGATFTLNTDIDGFNYDTQLTLTDAGTLTYVISASPNSSGSTKVYTYTFSGDIDSPFGQANPFVINQPSS